MLKTLEYVLLLYKILFRCYFLFMCTSVVNIFTPSLHDALPIFILGQILFQPLGKQRALTAVIANDKARHRIPPPNRSEEHTSELQSRFELVCSLLLEKKKRK